MVGVSQVVIYCVALIAIGREAEEAIAVAKKEKKKIKGELVGAKRALIPYREDKKQINEITSHTFSFTLCMYKYKIEELIKPEALLFCN